MSNGNKDDRKTIVAATVLALVLHVAVLPVADAVMTHTQEVIAKALAKLAQSGCSHSPETAGDDAGNSAPREKIRRERKVDNPPQIRVASDRAANARNVESV